MSSVMPLRDNMSLIITLYLNDELALKLFNLAKREHKKPIQIVKFALIEYLRGKK